MLLVVGLWIVHAMGQLPVVGDDGGGVYIYLWLPLVGQLLLVGHLPLMGQLPMVRRRWLTIVVRVQSPLVGERPVNYGGPVSCSGILTGEGSSNGRSSGTTVAQWLELQTLDKKRTQVRIVCRGDEHWTFRSLHIAPVQPVI